MSRQLHSSSIPRKLNLCILTQDETNKSCLYLKEAIEAQGHAVTLIQYKNDLDEYKKYRATKPEASWDINHKKGLLYRSPNETLRIDSFDGMMVRSWGTAPLAAEYATTFEKRGVILANGTAATL